MRRVRLLVAAVCMLSLQWIAAPTSALASDSGAGCHVVPPSVEFDPDTGTIGYSPGYVYCV